MTRLAARSIGRAHLAGSLSLSVSGGEVVGLIGPNGAGKTTLLRALAGLTAGRGSVELDGQPLLEHAHDVRSRRIAYVPATREVDWPISVWDIVALGREPHADRDTHIIGEALDRVDALPFARRRIDSLSTGERARVLLARALATRADVLLLDEPTSNLDPGHELSIIDVLKAEAARGAAVVASFHNLLVAERQCSRLVLIAGGALIADGDPATVLSDSNAAAAFGVRSVDGLWQACDGPRPGL